MLMDDDSPSASSDDLSEITSSSDETAKGYFTPRDYQIEIFQTVRKKNSIIVLGTGSGKTFISILLIKENGHQIRGKLSEGAKRSFFIVNSVPLVYQQRDAIANQTAFKVGAYEGSMGVDFWSDERWKKELEDNEVVVIVAQIFLNILLHKLIKFSDINLIVMDECHHAQGSHPMREAMREYCTFKVICPHILPRICGMTASVINCKISHHKVMEKMTNLETVLDSSLITTHYQESVSKYMTNAKERIILFKKNKSTIISQQMTELINNMTTAALTDMNASLVLDIKNRSKAEKFINKIGLSLKDMLMEIGEYSLREAVNLECESLETAESDNPSMKRVYSLMSKHFSNLNNSLQKFSFSNMEDHLTPKVLRLLEILNKGKDTDFHALVFVQRRNTAKLLYTILDTLAKKNHIYSFFKTEVVVGRLYSAQREDIRLRDHAKQEKVIRDFRQGLINILISTSVLEEGIDIRKCNLVVRFNIPQNYRSYIQSLGRARAIPSHFILLCVEDASSGLISDIKCYKEIHRLLTKSCLDRPLPTLESIEKEFSDDTDIAPFHPFGPLGPKITALSAISLLNMYCGRLPKDKFTNLTLDDVRKEINGLCYVGLKLPINAPFRDTVWSDPRASYDLAKRDAALKLCKVLYNMNKLNANLLPRRSAVDVREKDHLGIGDQLAASNNKTGTRKNRQFHKRKMCSAFKLTGKIFLHTLEFNHIEVIRQDIHFGGDYNLGFICSEVIAPAVFHLQHMKWGKLQIRPRYIKQIGFYEDISEIIKFHETTLSQVMGINKNLFIFEPSMAENIFIVPLNKDFQIDYHLIAKVNKSPFLNGNDKDAVISCHEKLLDSIVKPIHGSNASTFFFVKEIRMAYSPLSQCHDMEGYTNYVQYYKTKYGVDIKDHSQPLINCSHMPNNLNCLSDCKYGTVKYNILFLIPEVCQISTIPASLFWKLFCIPSILHRINGLQLEEELLIKIGCNLNYDNLIPLNYDWVNCTIDRELSSKSENICAYLVHKRNSFIPAGAILQALTPISSTDQFNLERLEVLGDSYLKFRSSKYLFLKEAMEDEGVLTQCRSNIISNKTLYILAEKKDLGDFVQGTMLQSPTFPYPYGFYVRPQAEQCLLRDSVNPMEWQKYGQKDVTEAVAKKEGNITAYNPYSEHLLPDKCIADTVEAMIGALLLCGGEECASTFMAWIGFKFVKEDNFWYTIPETMDNYDAIEFKNLFAKSCFDILEENIGYCFKRKNLLLEACTHPSYSYNRFTGCYQRLEFLGDSILDYLITGYIYTKYRTADPGKLTDWRSFYVNNETLARIAVENRFHVYLLHLSTSLEKAINTFINLTGEGVAEFNYEGDGVEVEDIEVPKALGDLVESIIGAVYVDSGFCLPTTWQLVTFLYKGIFDSFDQVPINCIRQLYEKDSSVKFEKKEEEDGRVVVIAHVKGLDPIKGLGKNWRIAKQAAAKYALHRLTEMDSPTVTRDQE